MGRDKVSTIINYLYKNNMLDKRYRIIYSAQYGDLSDQELLELMGIELQLCDTLDPNEGIAINIKNQWLIYDGQTKDIKGSRLFKIDRFNVNCFEHFKKMNFGRLFMQLILKLKAFLFAGAILKCLCTISLYVILTDVAGIIDDSYTINSKYIFEMYGSVALIAGSMYFVFSKSWDYLSNKIEKIVLIGNPVFLEDEKYAQSQLGYRSMKSIKSICNNLISIFPSIIIAIILFFHDKEILKFGLFIISIIIVISILSIIVLPKLGFFEAIKKGNLSKGGIETESIDFLIKYKFKQSIILNAEKLIYIYLVLGLCAYSSYRVLNDSLSIGRMLFYMVLIIVFINPVVNGMFNIPNYMDLFVKLRNKSIKDLIKKNIQKENTQNIMIIETPNITFKNAVFSYGRKTIFSNIDINIDKNQIIQIYGEAYSGKTTFANLIMKKIKTESGVILVDDSNIDDIKNQVINELVDYVTLDYTFLNTPIKNYLINNNYYSDNDITSLIQEIKLLSYLSRYPDYINTVIANTNELSSSEVSLLIIAKAIINDKRIIIMDQLLSSLNKKQLDSVLEVLNHLNSSVIILESKKIENKKIQQNYRISNKQILEKG